MAMLVIALIALIGGAVFWARPLLALGELKSALQARDENRVSGLVDFAELEKNMNADLEQRIEVRNQGKVFGGVLSKVEGFFAGIAVQDLATPSGLISLVCDTDAAGNIDRSPKPEGAPCKVDVDIKSAGYASRRRFSVIAERSNDRPMEIMMEQGIDSQWRLIGLSGTGSLSQ